MERDYYVLSQNFDPNKLIVTKQRNGYKIRYSGKKVRLYTSSLIAKKFYRKKKSSTDQRFMDGFNGSKPIGTCYVLGEVADDNINFIDTLNRLEQTIFNSIQESYSTDHFKTTHYNDGSTELGTVQLKLQSYKNGYKFPVIRDNQLVSNTRFEQFSLFVASIELDNFWIFNKVSTLGNDIKDSTQLSGMTWSVKSVMLRN